MVNLTEGIEQEKAFRSHAPGYWSSNGGVAPELWNEWKWQLKNRVTKLGQLEEHLTLSEEERAGVLLSGDKLALAITPHFFNLIPRENPDDPIRRQMIPRIEETWGSPYDMADPCGEDSHMPVPGLVHRYPDRVLFLVTDRCAAYCRYCTRSRVVSGVGEQELHTDFEEAFRYLEQHAEVRDVLLSGGDALIFSDDKIDKLLSRLRAIKHIEFLRIGTRIPIFLPQRITPELCAMLAKWHPAIRHRRPRRRRQSPDQSRLHSLSRQRKDRDPQLRRKNLRISGDRKRKRPVRSSAGIPRRVFVFLIGTAGAVSLGCVIR